MVPRIAIPRWTDVQLDWLHNYHDRLHDAGLETLDVTDATLGLQGCDGLLLTGGVDIDPALYGEALHPMAQTPVPLRDEMELTLLREALAADLPMLLICRGLQLLNVCLGGALLQHIESAAHVANETESQWHNVSVANGSRLREVLGAKARVNSRHHQAVTPAILARGLRITAMSDDGLVEGVEGQSQPWLVAVQWHPERLEVGEDGFIEDSKRLFQAFALAVVGGRNYVGEK